MTGDDARMREALLTIEGAIAIVTLNRPHRLNAIGGRLLDDLHEALASAQEAPEIRAIVLTGAGRAFCAGDDLKEFAAQAASPESVATTCAAIQRITRDIMLGPRPVIAAAAGHAVGGGFEWMLNCDLVVAAEDLVCFFPEMALGHFVTGGVTHLLPQALGHQRAMELLLLGDPIGATALRDLGLVNRVVPRAALMSTALALAGRVATAAPASVARLKRVMSSDARQTLARALAAEEDAARACFADPETARRIQAGRIAGPRASTGPDR
jgi:enoyl-CoA hydratase/carnithine racemase